MTRGPLEYSPSYGARYYKPARTSDPGRLALGTAIALVGALIVGAAYGIIDFHVSNLYGKAFSICGAAVAVGFVTLSAIKIGRVRTRATATVLAALIGLVALYASWVAWPWAVYNHVGVKFNPLFFVRDPIAHFRAVRELNEIGVWSYDRNVVRGLPLLIVWIAEAIIIVLGAVIVATSVSKDDVTRPFCERCRRWCDRVRGMPHLAAKDEETVANQVEARNFDALIARGPLLDDDEPHIGIELFRCPSCGETNVLSVRRYALVINEQGRYVTKATTLVDQLLITKEQAEEVQGLKAKVEAMRPPPPTEEAERPYDPAEDPG